MKIIYIFFSSFVFPRNTETNLQFSLAKLVLFSRLMFFAYPCTRVLISFTDSIPCTLVSTQFKRHRCTLSFNDAGVRCHFTTFNGCAIDTHTAKKGRQKFPVFFFEWKLIEIPLNGAAGRICEVMRLIAYRSMKRLAVYVYVMAEGKIRNIFSHWVTESVLCIYRILWKPAI